MSKNLHLLYIGLILLFACLSVSADNETNEDQSSSALMAASSNLNLTFELLGQRKQFIAEERQALAEGWKSFEENKQLIEKNIKDLDKIAITPTMLEKALLDKEAIHIKLESFKLEQEAARQKLVEWYNKLKEQKSELEILQKMPPTDASSQEKHQQKIANLKEKIVLQEQAIHVEEEHLETIILLSELSQNRLNLLTKWHDNLQQTYQKRQQQDLKTQIQQEQQRYLSLAAELRKNLERLQKEGKYTPAQHFLLETQIQDAEERAQQVERDLKLASLKMQLEKWQSLSYKNNFNFEETILNINQFIKEAEALATLIDNKILLLTKQYENVKKRGEQWQGLEQRYHQQTQKIIQGLIENTQTQLNTLKSLIDNAKSLLLTVKTAYKTSLRENLTRKRELPQTQEDWQSVLNELQKLPEMFFQQLYTIFYNIATLFYMMAWQTWLMISLILCAWILGGLWLQQWLHKLCNRLSSSINNSFFVTTLVVILKLLRFNTALILVFSIILSLTWFAVLEIEDFLFLFVLMAVILGVKLSINLAGLLLLPSKEPAHKRLYKQLVWISWITGLLVLATAIGHLWSLSVNVREIIDSIFMIFLALTIIPVMYIRRILLNILDKGATRYWIWVIKIITLLLPLSILSVSLLGLFGYINLGWTVAKYTNSFLIVLAGWLVIRGFLTDIINFLKNYALKRSSHYGLLWTQDIIPLLHNVLRTGLFLAAITVLFWLNEWYKNIAVESLFNAFLEYQIFNIGGNSIQLGAILLAILLLWAIFWLGNWFRQITYRWIYSNIHDLGIRNSLSVFTQYVVVLMGLMLTLQVIGIDLTTLTIFAGALGVGIGFGLQTIANNFISGILLLIERPLRTGDYVNISGTHEGEVTQIGIRSLTIRAWNHQEIIVPNSDVITNAFTNWTLSDPIMRTTLYVRIGYESDPHEVRAIFQKMLQEIPEIVADPKPIVTLWEFGEYFMLFRIDYFADVVMYGLFDLRTKVSLAIWDKLKAAGIQIPYPHHQVQLQSTSRLEKDEKDWFA